TSRLGAFATESALTLAPDFTLPTPEVRILRRPTRDAENGLGGGGLRQNLLPQSGLRRYTYQAWYGSRLLVDWSLLDAYLPPFGIPLAFCACARHRGCLPR